MASPDLLFFLTGLAMIFAGAIVMGVPLQHSAAVNIAESGPFRKQFVLLGHILMFLLGLYILFMGVSISIVTAKLLLGV